MKRIAIGCIAAGTMAYGCFYPGYAAAGDGFAAGLFGGLAAGTIFGMAAASPRVYYAEPVYAPACYWALSRPVWDGYRGIWVRHRIQVRE
jgi:hypothetical protein